MRGEMTNIRYHIKENGWENHERYKIAFPFAMGQIALDTPDDQLTAIERQGRSMFMSSCVTCHDRAKVVNEGSYWDVRAVSFPRGGYSHRTPGGNHQDSDAVTAATPYAMHEIPPKILDLTHMEKKGETLFQSNCAFCHAADGTGRNWIGSFLDPHPRDLTNEEFMLSMTKERLKSVISNGIDGTTMSAWRSVLKSEEIDAIVAYISRAYFPIE
ncbi:MAG: c-type cytochrome [Gammaproteobacteria bacterium]